MFTIADIRNIAIQIERNGEKTYRQAAAKATDSEVARLLESMAEDEKRHAQWFEKIQVDQVVSEEQRQMEQVGKSILQDMVKDRTFSLEEDQLKSAENPEKILAASQAFEQDTILFYEMLSEFIDNSETMEQLQVIIAEEQKHHRQLAEILGESTVQS
ncbi:MAG TPA: ferritin family protein [Desulfopila sp.]|nr:ferritin family protein [Desulfopila sp.]